MWRGGLLFFSCLKIRIFLNIRGLNSCMAMDNSNTVSWYPVITNTFENVGPEIVQRCPVVRQVTQIMQVCLPDFKKIILKIKAKLDILFKEFHGLHCNLLPPLEKHTVRVLTWFTWKMPPNLSGPNVISYARTSLASSGWSPVFPLHLMLVSLFLIT